MMEAQLDDDQQEVIYLVVDENSQGQQVTQIVSDGQLLGQHAQIIMQDGKQAVLITEGNRQQVVLLEDDVGPEHIHTVLQQGALQHAILQQPAQSIVLTSPTATASTSALNGGQVQYLVTENGEIITTMCQDSSSTITLSQTQAPQFVVTQTGMVRVEGNTQKKGKSLINQAALQEAAAKSPKRSNVNIVVSTPDISQFQISGKGTLGEFINQTVDHQMVLTDSTSKEVVLNQTGTMDIVEMEVGSDVAVDTVCKDDTDTIGFGDEEKITMVQEPDSTQLDVAVEDVELQMETAMDTMVHTTAEESHLVTQEGAVLPDQVMAEDEEQAMVQVPQVINLPETVEHFQNDVAFSETITTTSESPILISSRPLANNDVLVSSPKSKVKSVSLTRPTPTTSTLIIRQSDKKVNSKAHIPTTVITVISPPPPPAKQKKSPSSDIDTPIVSGSPSKLSGPPGESIASRRERRTSKPTRYYGLDDNYEVFPADIYRSHRQASDSEDGGKTKKDFTKLAVDSQESDKLSFEADGGVQKVAKQRGRPRKSNVKHDAGDELVTSESPESDVQSADEDRPEIAALQVKKVESNITESQDSDFTSADESIDPTRRGRARNNSTPIPTTAGSNTAPAGSNTTPFPTTVGSNATPDSPIVMSRALPTDEIVEAPDKPESIKSPLKTYGRRVSSHDDDIVSIANEKSGKRGRGRPPKKRPQEATPTKLAESSQHLVSSPIRPLMSRSRVTEMIVEAEIHQLPDLIIEDEQPARSWTTYENTEDVKMYSEEVQEIEEQSEDLHNMEAVNGSVQEIIEKDSTETVSAEVNEKETMEISVNTDSNQVPANETMEISVNIDSNQVPASENETLEISVITDSNQVPANDNETMEISVNADSNQVPANETMEIFVNTDSNQVPANENETLETSANADSNQEPAKLSPKSKKLKRKSEGLESEHPRRSNRSKSDVDYGEIGEEDMDNSSLKNKSNRTDIKLNEQSEKLYLLQKEVTDLKFVNDSLEMRLAQHSGSPEEIRSLHARIDKLQMRNSELELKLKNSEKSQKIGINIKGMKFSVKKDNVSMPSPTSESTSVRLREIECAEQELKARETIWEKKDQRAKAMDRELDERSSLLMVRESKLDRWERKLKSQEKEIEYKLKQHRRLENDSGGSGDKRKLDLELVVLRKELQEREEELKQRESAMLAKEKLLAATEQQLKALNIELNEKALYLQGKEQSSGEEESTAENAEASDVETVKSPPVVKSVPKSPKKGLVPKAGSPEAKALSPAKRKIGRPPKRRQSEITTEKEQVKEQSSGEEESTAENAEASDVETVKSPPAVKSVPKSPKKGLVPKAGSPEAKALSPAKRKIGRPPKRRQSEITTENGAPSSKKVKVDASSETDSTPKGENSLKSPVKTPVRKTRKSDVLSPAVTSAKKKTEKSDVQSPAATGAKKKQEKSDVQSPAVTSAKKKQEKSDVQSPASTSAKKRQEKSDVQSPAVTSAKKKPEKSDVQSPASTGSKKKQEKSDVQSPVATGAKKKPEKSDVQLPATTSAKKKPEKSDVQSPAAASAKKRQEKSDVQSPASTSAKKRQEKSDVQSPAATSAKKKPEKSPAKKGRK